MAGFGETLLALFVSSLSVKHETRIVTQIALTACSLNAALIFLYYRLVFF